MKPLGHIVSDISSRCTVMVEGMSQLMVEVLTGTGNEVNNNNSESESESESRGGRRMKRDVVDALDTKRDGKLGFEFLLLRKTDLFYLSSSTSSTMGAISFRRSLLRSSSRCPGKQGVQGVFPSERSLTML